MKNNKPPNIKILDCWCYDSPGDCFGKMSTIQSNRSINLNKLLKDWYEITGEHLLGSEFKNISFKWFTEGEELRLSILYSFGESPLGNYQSQSLNIIFYNLKEEIRVIYL
jgi:hypothetical protein